ncbi:CxxH/CxxC protein [Brevibacillus fluminis]|uniref:CxxH/CxxC protein n=1 Tax=Brevibacillus fluminis TaxID=511487 RepID=UPI003F8B8508
MMKHEDMKERTLRIQGKDVELQAGFPVVVSCMEDAEVAIDEYVDQYETAPDTFRRSDVEDETVPHVCGECGGAGEIVLLKEKGL